MKAYINFLFVDESDPENDEWGIYTELENINVIPLAGIGNGDRPLAEWAREALREIDFFDYDFFKEEFLKVREDSNGSYSMTALFEIEGSKDYYGEYDESYDFSEVVIEKLPYDLYEEEVKFKASKLAYHVNEYCDIAYQIAVDKGWHDADGQHEDGTKIALMHSELSEALEALRNGNPPDKHCPEYSSMLVELADTVIRIMNFCGEKNLDLGGAIVDKVEYNKKRPHKHGGKKF